MGTVYVNIRICVLVHTHRRKHKEFVMNSFLCIPSSVVMNRKRLMMHSVRASWMGLDGVLHEERLLGCWVCGYVKEYNVCGKICEIIQFRVLGILLGYFHYGSSRGNMSTVLFPCLINLSNEFQCVDVTVSFLSFRPRSQVREFASRSCGPLFHYFYCCHFYCKMKLHILRPTTPHSS